MFKKKKDNTKIYIIIGVAFTFVSLVFLSALQTSRSGLGEKEVGLIHLSNYSEFEQVKNEDKSVVVFGMDSCSFCQQAIPVMEKSANNTNTAVYYIDIEKLQEQDYQMVVNAVSSSFGEEWGVPLTIAYQNGQMKDSISGLTDEESYDEFFQKYASLGIILSENNNQNNSFNDDQIIDQQEEIELSDSIAILSGYEEFQTKKQNSNTIIVVGMGGCGFCQQALPIMDNVASDVGVTINYIDLETLSMSDYESVVLEVDSLFGNEWGVPLAIAYNEGEKMNSLSGLSNEEVYKNFFEDYGV